MSALNWKSTPALKQYIEWGVLKLKEMRDPDHIERFMFSLLLSVLDSETESLYELIYANLPESYERFESFEEFKRYAEHCIDQTRNILDAGINSEHDDSEDEPATTNDSGSDNNHPGDVDECDDYPDGDDNGRDLEYPLSFYTEDNSG